MRSDPLVLDIYFLLHIGKYLFLESSCLLWYPKPQEFLFVTELVTPLGSSQQLSFGSFLSTFNEFELLFLSCFCVGSGGMFSQWCLIGVKFVSACLFPLIFMHLSSCMRVFNSQSHIYVGFTTISMYTCGFTTNSHVYPQFCILEED